jgi:hypothetical protein
MNSRYNFMRIIAPNLRVSAMPNCMPLATRGFAGSDDKEDDDGHQPNRLAAVGEGAGGVLHRHCQESLDGKTVDWMEKVTDAQYGADRKVL